MGDLGSEKPGLSPDTQAAADASKLGAMQKNRPPMATSGYDPKAPVIDYSPRAESSTPPQKAPEHAPVSGGTLGQRLTGERPPQASTQPSRPLATRITAK